MTHLRATTILLLAACTAPEVPERDLTSPDSDTPVSDPWDALRAAIDASDLDDGTVLIGTKEGVVFSHSRGDATPETVYLLASASKWLSAITILSLVEDGVLPLDDGFQAALPWWDVDSARADVTLEMLLSFTSGFSGGIDDVPCVEDGETTLEDCARSIHDDFFRFAPGSTFYYGPAHLQLAGAAASAATGQRFHRLWRTQVADPLGLPLTAAYAVPSLDNPRVGGGASASANDYAAVLTALVAGELLSEQSIARMTQDHTPDGVTMEGYGDLPASLGWHYALGCWRECTDPETCELPGVVSSAGAFGFYPWWDQNRDFWGLIATQRPRGGARQTVPLGQAWAELAADALGR